MSTAIAQRCDDCGTALGEICFHEVSDAWICRNCFFRKPPVDLDEPVEPLKVSTPIEPLTPLEPVKASTTTLNVNGSVGVEVSRRLDGSVGVDETAARVKALGVTAPLGEEFDCVLPGHKGRARVHSTSKKFWRYQCADTSLGLAEVRACVGYGSVKRISSVEAARWRERLDYEAGLREPRTINLGPPEGLSSATSRVAGGLRLYLGLRDERWGDQPFTWAREFVMAWCGVSDQQAREAVWQLRQANVLVPTGEPAPRRPIVYRIGGES